MTFYIFQLFSHNQINEFFITNKSGTSIQNINRNSQRLEIKLKYTSANMNCVALFQNLT